MLRNFLDYWRRWYNRRKVETQEFILLEKEYLNSRKNLIEYQKLRRNGWKSWDKQRGAK